MDNKKVGKLIAKLRKEKELTQQMLGDKVGVGFRAVSKWERGLTMPDIGIVNELSKILGISSDELLSGELRNNRTNNKKKISVKFKVIVSIIISLILIITSILLYFNNKTDVYRIVSNNDKEYYIEGQVTLRKDEISIILNKLRFKNEKINSEIIKNYEYNINIDNECIFSYGYIVDNFLLDKTMSIENFFKKFRINYIGNTDMNKKELLTGKMSILFKFIDENDNEFIKEINIVLYEQKNNEKTKIAKNK